MEKANIKSYDTSPKIRYAWVDYAKFFSIFLVVSYHIPHRADGYVGELLSLLRMPAFFMIAGFLFNMNKDFIQSLTSKHILGAIIAFCITLVCIRYGNYSNMIFKNIQIVICGLLVMPIYTIFIKAFSHLKIDKAVSFIGKNTIIILALQNYIIGCFKLYFKSIIEYGGYATNIILTLLTIIICCLPIKLINSYVPFLVGRGPYFEKKLK